jgi:putative intracellular protease/amidase
MAETYPTGKKPDRDSPSILMPLPDHDFDPTETAIPWKVCKSQGWIVTFSTEYGDVPQADEHKLNGPLPGLISAGEKARMAYQQMTEDTFYQHPIPYAEINPDRYNALLLPGGDAPRMRQYLESAVVQSKVLQFWQQGKLIGAICHGILVLARTIDPQTGRSVLYGHKVTALPGSLDRFGYLFDKWMVKHGYIMYPNCVAEEVCLCLESPDDFSSGPGFLGPYVVYDGNLITARWYIDAKLFGGRFVGELQKRIPSDSEPGMATPS